MENQERKFTLLLVDDNPTNLTLLVKIIEMDLPQVRVLTASNGADGLQLAEQEKVDGAFIDVQMPEMSGLEMCRLLKANPRTAGMPLVLITAHMASPEMRAEGLEVGAYDFISQPISNVEMLARIKVMLRLCQSERETRQVDQPTEQQQIDHSNHVRWLSGLLLSGSGKLTTSEQSLLETLAAEYSSGAELDEQLLAKQLAQRFPVPWRRTFLKLSMLEKAPLALADKLSELKDVAAVFDYLQRHDLIVADSEQEDILMIKPQLIQGFRQEIPKVLEDEDQEQTSLLAADWYQQRNDPLAALRCLLMGKQYQTISQLLSQAGLKLLADECQPEIGQLLAQIPEEKAVGCGWMALYIGAESMQGQPFEVDSWLELSRNRFVSSNDQRGELLVLSQQIIQYLAVDGQVELGKARLVRLRELVTTQIDLLEPFNRLKVLFAHGTAEMFYAADLRRSEELLAQGMSEALREKQFEMQANIALLQAILGIYQGRYRVAKAAMEQSRAAYSKLSMTSYPAQVFHLVGSELLYASGALDSFVQQRDLVRKLWLKGDFSNSALASILSIHSALCDMAQGKPASAQDILEVSLNENPSSLRPHFQSWILQIRGLLHASSGRAQEAEKDCEKALALREQIGLDLYRIPNLLLAGATALLLKQYDRAHAYLTEGLETSLALGEERYRGGFRAWLGAFYIEQGDFDQAKEQLGILCSLLRRQDVNFFFALTPELIRRFLPLAAESADCFDHLQQMTTRWLDCGISADVRLVPQAHLQVLGGFKFRLQDKDCDLSEVGQSSRQLMALLAIAPNHSMSSEMLMGTLWPESPPSKARNSFDTALSRLRKVLESYFGKPVRQDYLLLEKGMLLLRYLQLDSNDFKSYVEKSRRHLQRQNDWQAELELWKAEHLWQGEFLAGFELDADLPYRRDELNQLRMEQLSSLAALLKKRGDIEEAIRLLLLGLQAEPTHDVLVQQLLSIYQQQNDRRASRQLLENYQSALHAEDYDEEEIEELIATLGPQRFEG